MDKKYLVISYLNQMEEDALRAILTDEVFDNLAETARLAEVAKVQQMMDALGA